jgi:hypothetical protein
MQRAFWGERNHFLDTMTAFLTRLLLVIAIIPLVAGAMRLANDFDRSDRVSHLSDLNGPALWTSEPVRIDVAAQSYERLPSIAVASADIGVSTQSQVSKLAISTDNGRSERTEASGAVNSDAVAWCRQRYKSYDPLTTAISPMAAKCEKLVPHRIDQERRRPRQQMHLSKAIAATFAGVRPATVPTASKTTPTNPSVVSAGRASLRSMDRHRSRQQAFELAYERRH